MKRNTELAFVASRHAVLFAILLRLQPANLSLSTTLATLAGFSLISGLVHETGVVSVRTGAE